MTNKEAIMILESVQPSCEKYSYSESEIYEAIDMAIQALSEPERKNGRWIEKEDPYGYFDSIPVCSECGHTPKMRETSNFCPNCGADNR